MTEPKSQGQLGAVIFDWDGVLVDSSGNYYRAYELLFEELGIATSPREIYLREGQPTPLVIADLCADRGVPISEEGIRAAVLKRRAHDAALGPRTFFPNIPSLLTRLRNSGYKLAMVTGSSRKSVQLVLSSKQEEAFDAVITADDVTRPKPDPQPFLMAAKQMGLHPSDCVVVENAPFGIRGARAAGCHVVAICTTLPPEDLAEAEFVVRDHNELEVLLAAILRLAASSMLGGEGE